MLTSKNYYRIMLGKGSAYAEECYKNNFIGADFDINQDLKNELPEDWRAFNKKFIPVWLEKYPGRSKVAAGLSCGALHTISKGIKKGDIVLCPNGTGSYLIGEVISDYSYHPDSVLPHQREVRWYNHTIDRAEMSEALRNSSGSIGSVSNITKYAEELKVLIGDQRPRIIVAMDDTIEEPSIFALEKHLEDFLVSNWKQTILGKNYNIYEEEGELIGQQYPSDTGPIDILAIHKNGKELLVVELKKGRASDVVVGQIQRYMGYVQEELAESDQTVHGAIIALENDLRLRRALAVTRNIDFYRYEVSFKLKKG